MNPDLNPIFFPQAESALRSAESSKEDTEGREELVAELKEAREKLVAEKKLAKKLHAQLEAAAATAANREVSQEAALATIRAEPHDAISAYCTRTLLREVGLEVGNPNHGILIKEP